jgi:hypothetical protein
LEWEWKMMNTRNIALASVLSVTALPFLSPSNAFAFVKGSTEGVVSVLLKKYTLTETTGDKSQITHDGTSLSLKQAGVYSTPAKGFLTLNSTVVDGRVQKQNFFVSSSCSKSHCHVLQSGEKVYVTKIESKDEGGGDLLKFSLISAEDIDGGEGAERYGATVTFKFKKGYLTESSPEDVEQAVEAVLSPEDSGGGDAKQETASAPAAAPAPVQRAAAPPPPPPPPSGSACWTTAVADDWRDLKPGAPVLRHAEQDHRSWEEEDLHL